MKKLLLFLIFACLVLVSAAADRHPKTDEINALIRNYGYDQQITEIASMVSHQSMQLNQEGFKLYEQKKYDAALEKFKQAVSADDSNSIAYYNAACVVALQYASRPASDSGREALLPVIVRYLNQAGERSWYWALQMMADSDLNSVKSFSGTYGGYGDTMRITIGGDLEYGYTFKKLNRDGTTTIYAERDMQYGANENRSDYDGYYCIIGGYVFVSPLYAVWGTNFPADKMPAFFYPVKAFLPESYYSSGR